MPTSDQPRSSSRKIADIANRSENPNTVIKPFDKTRFPHNFGLPPTGSSSTQSLNSGQKAVLQHQQGWTEDDWIVYHIMQTHNQQIQNNQQHFTPNNFGPPFIQTQGGLDLTQASHIAPANRYLGPSSILVAGKPNLFQVPSQAAPVRWISQKPSISSVSTFSSGVIQISKADLEELVNKRAAEKSKDAETIMINRVQESLMPTKTKDAVLDVLKGKESPDCIAMDKITICIARKCSE